MTAVSSEFYDFLDSLKESDDRTSSELVEPCGYNDPKLEFEFDQSTCSVCNGYYGPCFGEPVCMACHNFLFPEFSSFLPAITSNIKTDDGDSGNDEPSDLNFGTERHSTRKKSQINIKWLFHMNPDNEDVATSGGSGESASSPPPLPPPAVPQLPPLQHALQLLSTAQPGDGLAAGLVERLPPEVLLCIFSYLDDLTLCAAVDVCTRWRRLLEARIPPSKWEDFTERRWPLYRPLFNRNEWCTMYKNLVNSTFCRTCVMQMAVQLQPTGEENSWRRNRLRSELKIMRNDPPEGIAAIPLDAKCFHWQASITGPVGSPYEGGIFFLYIQVPSSYPMSPPMVRFLTKVLHPNVSRHGDVGIDSVHHNWSLALTISKVLISIQSLLTDPYTSVCMEPELGNMYRDNRARFEELARRWTWRYAMCDALNFNYNPQPTH